MMGEQATSLPVPDLGRRETPASRLQATYEHDICSHECIDVGRQDAADPERTREHSVYEVVHYGPAPSKPDLRLLALREQDLKQVELHLRGHPPRDFRKESATEVYQDYVGFIEIYVTGESLASTVSTIGILDYRCRRLDWLELVRHRSRTRRPVAGNALLRPCGRQAVPVLSSKTG